MRTLLNLVILGLAAFGAYVLYDRYYDNAEETYNKTVEKVERAKKAVE